MIPELETERLRLRAFREEDLDAWAAVLADPGTARFIGGVRDRAEAWRSIAVYLGHWSLRGYGQWALEERASGALAGRCGLWFPEGWPELEVGWTLAPGLRGRGLATEAARAAVGWARAQLGLRRIASVIAPANTASIAVAERLGMAFDHAATMEGDPVSVYAMSL